MTHIAYCHVYIQSKSQKPACSMLIYTGDLVLCDNIDSAKNQMTRKMVQMKDEIHVARSAKTQIQKAVKDSV